MLSTEGRLGPRNWKNDVLRAMLEEEVQKREVAVTTAGLVGVLPRAVGDIVGQYMIDLYRLGRGGGQADAVSLVYRCSDNSGG